MSFGRAWFLAILHIVNVVGIMPFPNGLLHYILGANFHLWWVVSFSEFILSSGLR